MERGSKKIKKSEKSEEGILSYEIINNIEEDKPHEIQIEQKIEPTENISTEQEKFSEAKKRNPLRTLIILIIILIIMDFIFLFAYYKPDMKSILANIFKPKVTDETALDNVLKCNDGTPYNSCAKNKPYFCYDGELLKSAYNCGCPDGYKVDFQDCKEI